MTHTRRLWALLALVLTLVLAACSTPADLNVPTLEPQFGTADEDIGVDVATVSTGRIYSLSQQSGPNYEYDYDGNYYQYGTYSKVLLKRQDGSGNVTWSKEVASAICRDYSESYYYSCSTVKPISVFADAQGNVSVLTSYSSEYYDYYDDYSSTSVSYTVEGCAQ